MSVISLVERRDSTLKSEYLQKLQELGIVNPGILSRIEAYLTPEKIASHREEINAVIRGEVNCPCPAGFT